MVPAFPLNQLLFHSPFRVIYSFLTDRNGGLGWRVVECPAGLPHPTLGITQAKLRAGSLTLQPGTLALLRESPWK